MQPSRHSTQRVQMDSNMRNIFSVCAVGAAALAGCGAPDQTSSGSPTSPQAVPSVLLAQPCPLAPPGDDAGPLSANPRVFIEIASIEGNIADRLANGSRTIARTFGEWLNDPNSGARGVGGVLATVDTVAKVPLDLGSGWESKDGGIVHHWDLALTPHVGDHQTPEVRMDVAIEPATPLRNPDGSSSTPEHRRARTTLVMLDQKPMVIGLDPLVSGPEKGRGWTLLLTPYLVRRDDDLRRLFECRIANRSRVLR